MNRRSILGAIAGAPFVGRHIAGEIAKNHGRALGGIVESGSADASSPGARPMRQAMPRWKAAQAVLGDPQVLADLRSALFDQHRFISFIEPDIETMRSWSPMAKIAFQRQRNVEREVDSIINESKGIIGDIMEKIHKMTWGG